MAERRTRESRWADRWPSIAAVAAVVVAVGFAVGVIAGITWEEPGLVVGYLSGQTDEIEWSDDAEPVDLDEQIAAEASDTPSVAAPPPALPPLGQRSGSKPSAPEAARSAPDAAPATQPAAPAPKPAAAKPAASPPKPSASGFAVQVGAFAEKSSAEALASRLRKSGYPVYLSPGEGASPSWRVRVGPMPTRPEAEKAASKLQKAEKLPTWVLGEGT